MKYGRRSSYYMYDADDVFRVSAPFLLSISDVATMKPTRLAMAVAASFFSFFLLLPFCLLLVCVCMRVRARARACVCVCLIDYSYHINICWERHHDGSYITPYLIYFCVCELSHNDLVVCDSKRLYLYTAFFFLSLSLLSFFLSFFVTIIHRKGVITALFGCYMTDASWNCCRLGARFVCTIKPCSSVQRHFIWSDMRSVHARLAYLLLVEQRYFHVQCLE